MYQLVIATPLGELVSKSFNSTDLPGMKNLLDKLGDLSDFHVELEDDSIVYITKDMIGRSVFFLKSVQ